MIFNYGKNDFKSFDRGQELTYLLTNGLGGFSSTSIINSLTRKEHSLFMACTKAPNNRYNIVSKIEEILHIGDKKVELSSQEYVCYTKNKTGFLHLHSFSQEYLPKWTFFFDGVEITKTIVYEHEKNTLGVKYTIINRSNYDISLELKPLFSFTKKSDILISSPSYTFNGNVISSNNLTLNISSNYSTKTTYETDFQNDYYFSYDSVDGRSAIGSTFSFISYFYNIKANSSSEANIIFSLEENPSSNIDELISSEINRQEKLLSLAKFKNPIANALVRASDQFISYRESTNSKTILAGYPWFEDWGRDTMFALLGSTISTNRFEDSKDIFRTFILHLNRGLMPNLFPEGENAPLYNTVDASLLFIYAVYEYYKKSDDINFIKDEAFSAILEIIDWYKKGTDFNIYMDDDFLIHAGEGFDQVTWMDVRFNNILPTARHGKPVEINAFWYNALKVAEFFSTKLGYDGSEFLLLSEKVKESFNNSFWNEKENCLKDVVSGNSYDYQVRSNQIWATMLPFSPLENDKSKLVVEKVYTELYTPYGLRTLSKYDPEFVPSYGGSHFKRDMSYHQGTVWTFPLGGYFLSYLKVNNYSKEAKQVVEKQLSLFESCLREGCVGQIAEIYDGLYPTASRGCFAQAWSVSEILRVFRAID